MGSDFRWEHNVSIRSHAMPDFPASPVEFLARVPAYAAWVSQTCAVGGVFLILRKVLRVRSSSYRERG